MRICRLFPLAVVGALVLAPLAQAKGPSKAAVNGPGVKKAVIINGNGEGGPGTPLGNLVESVGSRQRAAASGPVRAEEVVA